VYENITNRKQFRTQRAVYKRLKLVVDGESKFIKYSCVIQYNVMDKINMKYLKSENNEKKYHIHKSTEQDNKQRYK
jgi:hypothetical protein